MCEEIFPLDRRDPLAMAITDAIMESVLAGYAAKQLSLELNEAGHKELARVVGTEKFPARWGSALGVVPIRRGRVNAIVIADSEESHA